MYTSNNHFFAKLETRVHRSNSLLCIGLDPHKNQLPSNPTCEDAYNFCVNIIKATAEFAVAFKPNSAFFESLGPDGFDTLRRVIADIPDDIPVILDSKRGDIDTTAQAYAEASYEHLAADSVTLSPYMGWNSVQPFVTGRYSGKGAWILYKTSNETSKDLQELRLLSGELLYEKVADLCQEWNSTNSCNTCAVVGIVAGATDLNALTRIRRRAPDMWILCPGVGAQGGDLQSVCRAGLRQSDQSGLLVSVSRAISSADDMTNAARYLRDEINSMRAEQSGRKKSSDESETASLQQYQRDFIELAIATNGLQFGLFRLKSGRESPYFFNAGQFCSGSSLTVLGRCYAQTIHNSGVTFDVVFGPAYKGIPLCVTVAMAYTQLYGGEDKKVCYNRKEIKDHGEGGLLVGADVRDKRVLVVDDVITAGTAIRETIAILTLAGAQIAGVVVCLDREERITVDSNVSALKAVETEFSVPVLAVTTLQDLITYMQLLERTTKAGSTTIDVPAMEDKAKCEFSVTDIMCYREKYGVK